MVSGAWWRPPASAAAVRAADSADDARGSRLPPRSRPQVGHRRLEHRVPVDQALAAVDQALSYRAHEGLVDHLADRPSSIVKYSCPVTAGAEPAHLAGDGAPDRRPSRSQTRSRKPRGRVVAAAFVIQLALDDDLRGDLSVSSVAVVRPPTSTAGPSGPRWQRVWKDFASSVMREAGRRQLKRGKAGRAL